MTISCSPYGWASSGMVMPTTVHSQRPVGSRPRRSPAARVDVRLAVALDRQIAARGEVPLAGHQQVLGGELGDHLGALSRNHQLLLDPRRTPAVGGWPVRLEGEDHSLLEDPGGGGGGEAGEDRAVPEAQG